MSVWRLRIARAADRLALVDAVLLCRRDAAALAAKKAAKAAKEAEMAQTAEGKAALEAAAKKKADANARRNERR
eukprot:SAG31_NODE_11280_length_1046_cov_1.794087_3_plen_74_part_00